MSEFKASIFEYVCVIFHTRTKAGSVIYIRRFSIWAISPTYIMMIPANDNWTRQSTVFYSLKCDQMIDDNKARMLKIIPR